MAGLAFVVSHIGRLILFAALRAWTCLRTGSGVGIQASELATVSTQCDRVVAITASRYCAFARAQALHCARLSVSLVVIVNLTMVCMYVCMYACMYVCVHSHLMCECSIICSTVADWATRVSLVVAQEVRPVWQRWSESSTAVPAALSTPVTQSQAQVQAPVPAQSAHSTASSASATATAAPAASASSPERFVYKSNLLKGGAVAAVVPPKTMVEFERTWRNVESNPEKAEAYLKVVDGPCLQKICKGSLNSEVLMSVVRVLHQRLAVTMPDACQAFLVAFSTSDRFALTVQFLTTDDLQGTAHMSVCMYVCMYVCVCVCVCV
jgi:hypothetical protein